MLQQNSVRRFKVNEFITLKLENNTTNIYVNNKPFDQCKHLLLNLDSQSLEKYDSISSIDEAVDVVTNYHYGYLYGEDVIPPETEFWGHCSNLQAWFEHDYDTRLLHRNIAFPLLKRLTEVGDPIAKKRFKEEIVQRFLSGHLGVMQFLIGENYLDYLNREDINFLVEHLIESLMSTKHRFESLTLSLTLDTLRKFLVKAKNIIDIIEIYEKLLTIEPYNNRLWKHFSQFYINLIEGQSDPLPSFLPPILNTPKHADFWKNIGYYYFFRGEFDKGVNAFEKTLEIEPLSAPVIITLMKTHDYLLEIDESINLCQQLIQILPENQNFLIYDIYFYLKNSMHLFPLEFYDQVIEIETLAQKIMMQNKLMSKRRRQRKLSLERLIKLSESNPKNVIIWNLLTLGFIYNRNFDNAINSQLKVLDFNRKNPQIYSNLCYLHYLKNDFSQAISYCEEALEITPDRPDWWIFIAKLYWMKGNFKEALKNCIMGISRNPGVHEIRNQLSYLYLHSRKYDSAIAVCNVILKKDPPFSFKSSLPKRYSNSISRDGSFKKKIVNNPDYDYAITWRNLGYAYYKKKFRKRAIIAFNNSLTFNPSQPIVNFFLSKL